MARGKVIVAGIAVSVVSLAGLAVAGGLIPGRSAAPEKLFASARAGGIAPAAVATPMPPEGDATACGTRVALQPLVTGTGPVASIAAGSDVAGDLRSSQRLVVRVTFPGPVVPHQVFVDTDDRRDTGMWTYQSPVSSSGWDLLVDAGGTAQRHTGTNAQWRFSPARGVTRTVAGQTVQLCLAAPETDRVRIAVAVGDDWLPGAFLPGAAYPVPAGAEAAEEPSGPERLAINYSATPWTADYDAFGHVVLGAGLEDPSHPSHRPTSALVKRLGRAGTEVWGYVSLVGSAVTDGARDRFYSAGEAIDRAKAWKAMGATGIFLDEADLCITSRGQQCVREVSRAHQQAVIDGVHALGLPVFANAYAPFDILGTVDGAAPALGRHPGDMYLLENPTLVSGGTRTGVDAAVSQAKLALAARLRAATGVRMAAVDTSAGANRSENITQDPGFRAAWAAAASAGLDAYGFTNASYSAAPNLAGDLPVIEVPRDLAPAHVVPAAAAELLP